MKKPIHLYIFVVLSMIASLYRVFSSFVSNYDEEAMRQLIQGVDESFFTYLREVAVFQTNAINKGFALVLLLLVIATIVLLFLKKNEQASYTYLAYLFGTLLSSTYVYLGGKGLTSLYTDPVMRQSTSAGLLGTYIVQVILFAIYFGLTVFFHLRKPKEKPSTDMTATDI